MRKNKKEIIKILLSDFALFIFFVFVVSDLINMHLRLIYHINLFSSQNIYQGTVKKLKEDKNKIVEFYIIDNLFDQQICSSYNFKFIKSIYFKNNFLNYFSFFKSQLQSRAPPSL